MHCFEIVIPLSVSLGRECGSMFSFCVHKFRKYMESGVPSMCFHGDFNLKTVVGFVHRKWLGKGVICWNIFIHIQNFSSGKSCCFICRLCCRNPDSVHIFGSTFTKHKCSAGFFFQVNNNHNIINSLRGETTGDWWIPPYKLPVMWKVGPRGHNAGFLPWGLILQAVKCRSMICLLTLIFIWVVKIQEDVKQDLNRI